MKPRKQGSLPGGIKKHGREWNKYKQAQGELKLSSKPFKGKLNITVKEFCKYKRIDPQKVFKPKFLKLSNFRQKRVFEIIRSSVSRYLSSVQRFRWKARNDASDVKGLNEQLAEVMNSSKEMTGLFDLYLRRHDLFLP